MAGGIGEPIADLHALDGLDAHHRRTEATVEPLVPLAVRAQSDGQSVSDHLEDAAQRVARGPRSFDELGRLRLEILVSAPQRGLFHSGPPRMAGAVRAQIELRGHLGPQLTDAEDVAADLDTELAQEDLSQTTGRHT